MAEPRLEDVGARLEAAVAQSQGHDLEGEVLYRQYEAIAIQILDSEFESFAPGELERYLIAYLQELRDRLQLDR